MHCTFDVGEIVRIPTIRRGYPSAQAGGRRAAATGCDSTEVLHRALLRVTLGGSAAPAPAFLASRAVLP